MIDIEIKDIFTVGIAVVGWVFGIIQFIAKRKWQKKIYLEINGLMPTSGI